jgi:hypothetical protein
MRGFVMEVDSLYEQRPTRCTHRRQRRSSERPVAERPAARGAADEARLDVVARGQSEQIGSGERRYGIEERAAHEQRFALPVPVHEFLRRQSAEQP